jgi:FkbH-like protein
MSHVQLFDFGAVVEQVGIDSARNSEGDALARMPYSAAMYQALAIALVRQILAARRSPAKVIAVDCDNTLWGGVVGESGLDEILLSADGPGRSFQLFQKHLKRLKQRGVLLAIVSTNEEGDVQGVFRDHPEMVLRAEDIAAWSINWKAKSENLRELVGKLHLSIDSFVFLDDDPAIRMEVAMRLPGIHVVPLPADPALFVETLEKLWLFDGTETDTDRSRTRLMQEEEQRESLKNSAASLDEYLATLQLEIEVREPLDAEWPRIAQLTQRTNQFNLSLRRRTVEEIRAMTANATILVLRARDRFGDYGLVGLCILRKASGGTAEIDTLLMSCRALGRCAEDAFLHAIAQAAVREGVQRLSAAYVEGPRNRVMREFIEGKGFSEGRPGVWTLSIPPVPPYPRHVRSSENMTVLRST